MSDLVERLRGYNPPDRTVDDQRQIAVDIHEAADRIEALEKALREAQQLATEVNDSLKACHEYFEKRSSVRWSDPLRAQVRDAIRRITTADHFWNFVENGDLAEFTQREALERIERIERMERMERALVRDAARIDALETALREIACFPHTPSKNMAAKQMSLIAHAALAPEQEK